MNKDKISKSIFREYDIRGIVDKTLFEKNAYLIGKGFCSLNKKLKSVVVCRDGRLSSPLFSESLVKGILESGVNVIDIGCGPTPMLYFASIRLNADAGIMVTGSHNPKNHNGFKIILNNKSFFGNNIKRLYEFILKGQFIKGEGVVSKRDIKKDYITCLLKKSGPFPNIKVLWDCGNGATGEIVSLLVKKLPGQHKVLFSKIDGNFPNHHPDPTIEKNLLHLKETMELENADLGVSFDGDGDRIGVLSKDKNLVPGDLLTAFLAGSILKKKKKEPIILDIKSSKTAMKLIENQNGKVVMSKTGHSLIKTKLKEICSPLAGEMSGHIFFNDYWFGFDDGIYSALRCLQEIEVREGGLNTFLKNIPTTFVSPEIRINCSDEIKFKVVEKVKNSSFKDYNKSELLTIDGIRATSEIGWWLLRASNTQAALIARAEGYSEKDLENLLKEISMYLDDAGIKWTP